MSVKVTDEGVVGSYGFETEQIQGVFDNAEEGEEVIFPAVEVGDNREYQVSNPIYIRKSVTIKGESSRTRITQRSSNQPIFIIQPDNPNASIIFQDLELNGGTNCLHFSSSFDLSSNSFIKNVYIHGHTNAGIYVDTPNVNIKVKDTYISGGAFSMYVTASSDYTEFCARHSVFEGATDTAFFAARSEGTDNSGSFTLDHIVLKNNFIALSLKDVIASGTVVTFVNNDGQINLEGSGALVINNSTASVVTNVPSKAQEITVAQADADFSSLSAACASIVDSSPAKFYLINVYPGIYVEQPFRVPQYVNINGFGSTAVTVFAADNNNPLISLSNSVLLSNMTFAGPTNSVGIDCQNIKGLWIKDVISSNARIGIRFSGSHPDGSAFGAIQDCFVVDGTADVSENGILFENGAVGNIDGVTVSGSSIAGLNCVGSGSRMLITAGNILHCQDALSVENMGQIRFRDSTFRFCNSGIRSSRDGSPATVYGMGAIIQECTHTYIQSGSGRINAASLVLDEQENFILQQPLSATISFLSPKVGDEGFDFEGEINVGIPERGRELTAGEGDSYTRGMIVLTSDGTATQTTDGANFIDVSISASQKDDGINITFQGTGSGHCIYVGSSLSGSSGVDAGDNLRHWGVKLEVPIERVGGVYVPEYWNGSTWATLSVMQSMSDYPYTVTGSTHLLEETGSFQIRYGLTENTNWVKKNINNLNLYWTRYRILTGATQTPEINQIKLHPSRYEINADGFTERYGLARVRRELQWHRNLTDDLSGLSPSDGNIPIANGFVIAAIDNRLTANAIDGNGGIAQINSLIDTSLPFTFRLGYTLDDSTSGNIIWEFRYRIFGPGDTLLTSNTVNETQIVTSSFTTPTTGTLRFQEFSGSMTNATPGESYLAIYYARRGSDLADNKVGNVTIAIEQLFANVWQ